MALRQCEVVIQHNESEDQLYLNRGEEPSWARMLPIAEIESCLVRGDPLVLLAGKAPLLSKTIVSVTIKLVWVLVMLWVVRDGFDWTADKCTFGNDCAIGEPEILKKNAFAEDCSGGVCLALLSLSWTHVGTARFASPR